MRKLLLKLVASDRNNLDVAVFLLRLLAGSMMLTHGFAKIAAFSTLSAIFPDPIGLGSTVSLVLIIFAEAGCSLLLILGLMTRLATLPLMFGMLVAAFAVNGTSPFSAKELPLLYLGMYIVLLWAGACRYSLDEIIRRKLTPRKMAG